MAFRPFEFFRRRQKLFLAVMAIMAMFLFVVGDAITGMRSGGGGILGGMTGLFGTPRNRVAVVDGGNLDIGKLHELAARREGALRLVYAVRGAAEEAVLRDAGMTDADMRLARSPNEDDRRRFRDKLLDLEKKKPDLRRKMEETHACLANEAIEDVEAFSSQQAYFKYFQKHMRMPSPQLSAEGLVEFAWWRDKADELGIVFSPAKVKEDLALVGGTNEKGEPRLKPEDLAGILRDSYRDTREPARDLDTLLGYLGDEMRVMVAKGALQGQQRRTGFGTGPLSTQATPLDLWNAYVDVRTQLDVGILPINVNQQAFLSQVPEPSAEQVADFYKKYSNQEPDAARETPGFRIPRLYKIEFVYADLAPTADAGKYYHDWARAIQALDPVAFFAEATEFYNKNKATRYRVVDPFYVAVSGSTPEDAIYYRSPLLSDTGPWLTPAAAEKVTAAQATLGVTGVLASAPAVPLGFGPALQLAGKIVPRQQEQSIELAALVGDAAAAATGGLGVTGLLTYPPRLGYIEKYQPLEKEFGGIVDELTEVRAHKLLEQDLATLKADLAKYGETYRKEYAKFRSRPGAAAAKKTVAFTPPPFTYKHDGKDVSVPIETYVADFAKARGLKYEGMKELRSKADLFKEKDATPLASILKPLFFETSYSAGRNFDNVVAEQLTTAGQTGLMRFQGKRVPDEQETLMRGLKPRKYALYWKQDETEGRKPDLEEVRAQVVEAWKLQEARALAEKAAQDLAAMAAKDGADGYRLLRDSKEGEYVEKTLGRFESSALGVGVLSYRDATIPTIDPPQDGLLNDLLRTLEKPGQTMVVTNKPKSAYYVLFLKERRQPRANDPLAVSEFDHQVILPNPQRQLQVNSVPISDWVLREQNEKYQKDWQKYFKDVTRYNQELGDQFKANDRQR